MDILAEMLGSMLIALGIYNFALEAGFPMSGFSGLAMIIYRLTGLPIGVMIICRTYGYTSLFPGMGMFFTSFVVWLFIIVLLLLPSAGLSGYMDAFRFCTRLLCTAYAIII
ncbi:MAG: YitT family protein [Lachnospiraceae bacterium]